MERRHLRRSFGGRATVIAAVLTALSLASSRAPAAGPVVVIVNASNPVPSLTLDEVHEFYHNERLTWLDGRKATLYDLRLHDEARRKFSEVILGQPPERVAIEWANKKITNTAKNPPRTVGSAALMQERVGKDRTAIGYLFQSDLSAKNVKVVAVIE